MMPKLYVNYLTTLSVFCITTQVFASHKTEEEPRYITRKRFRGEFIEITTIWRNTAGRKQTTVITEKKCIPPQPVKEEQQPMMQPNNTQKGSKFICYVKSLFKKNSDKEQT